MIRWKVFWMKWDLMKILKKNAFLLEGISDELDKSCKKDIVFYRIDGSQQSFKILSERLRRGKPRIIVFNKNPSIEINCAYVIVSEEKFFYFKKKICDVIYPIYLKKSKIVGVTGTNGKTSVCHFISESLVHFGYSVLNLGTTGAKLYSPVENKVLEKDGLTTPSYIKLRKLFFENRNCFDFVVMELSSHGLEQDRLGDIKIDLGVWTNFTQDHLDYHKKMEDYFLAKSKIYQCLKPSSKVLVCKNNREILDRLESYQRSQTVLFDVLELISNQKKMNKIFGKGFMLRNVATAFFAVKELLGKEVRCWDFITLPLGRFNIVEKGKKTIVVDYAHTPDALKNLIFLAKEYFINKKISILFGCGGERDKEKRSQMGYVAETHADKIYITSDNPRGEEPTEILNHIKSLLTKPFFENIDRKETIKIAIDEMKQNEVLLIAGKGHECYQEIDGVKHHFNDLEIVRECLDL